MQEALCHIFEKALKIDQIGIDDDFFALGGTSLIASKVVILCFNENIPLVYADLFKYRTVRNIYDAIINGNTGMQDENELTLYDYDEINEVISSNSLDNVDGIELGDIGDVLLAGADGYLGSHILKEYLDNYNGKIYCLLHAKDNNTARENLKKSLKYYFNDQYEYLFDNRIKIIHGDISDLDFVLSLVEYKFDTLINCAAIVKHFVQDDTLEKVNVIGTKNLATLCKAVNKRMIHISTISVAGESRNSIPSADTILHENELFFGQYISNEYVKSKFMAEREVLEEVSKGLDAKIIRVGNLMNRSYDGGFQVNFDTNAFWRIIRGYATLGYFPVGGMGKIDEFSPIDCVAKSVLKLAGTEKKYTIFHSSNSHSVQIGDVINALKQSGFKIEVVKDEEFMAKLKEYLAENPNDELVSGIFTYNSREVGSVHEIGYSKDYTINALYRLDFIWPLTDMEYLKKSIKELERLGLFKK